MVFKHWDFKLNSVLNRYHVVCGLLMLLVIVLISVILLRREPIVVTYNVNHTLTLFSQTVAKKSLTPAELKALTHRFSQTLSRTVNAYAASHHVIIVKSSAIVAGSQDITSLIEQQLSQNMKEKK